MAFSNTLCVIVVVFGALYGGLVSFNYGIAGKPLDAERRMPSKVFYPTLLSVGGALVWIIFNITTADIEGGFIPLLMIGVVVFLGCVPSIAYRIGVMARKN